MFLILTIYKFKILHKLSFTNLMVQKIIGHIVITSSQAIGFSRMTTLDVLDGWRISGSNIPPSKHRQIKNIKIFKTTHFDLKYSKQHILISFIGVVVLCFIKGNHLWWNFQSFLKKNKKWFIFGIFHFHIQKIGSSRRIRSFWGQLYPSLFYI